MLNSMRRTGFFLALTWAILTPFVTAGQAVAVRPLSVISVDVPGDAIAVKPALAGTSWTLVSWGNPDSPNDRVANTEITLAFEDDRIGGTSGCNRFMASYTANNSQLEIGVPAGTRMACPEEIMEQEFKFLAALEGAQDYAIADGQLRVNYTTDEGEGVLIFAADGASGQGQTQPPSASAGESLAGTSWMLASWGDPDSQNTPLPDTEITLVFDEDSLGGSSGCNLYTAPYTAASSGLEIGVAAGTLMMCPEEIMDQEFEFLTALQGAQKYAIADGQLRVNYTTDEGAGVLVFEPEETATESENQKTIYVASQMVDCVGVGPQKCLQVREEPGADWQFHYSGIEGFNYEPGYNYTLRIREEAVENPPADASSIRWILVDIVDKTVE
jgi:heat shock protein HslJ